jgi:hypothetical protein
VASIDPKLQAYFHAVTDYSRDLMDRLPISAAIEPIADTFARLKPALDNGLPAEVARLAKLGRPQPDRNIAAVPAGMNTIGILADRLTILICKEWYLRHRQNRPAEADELCRTQTADIVAALAAARPGHAKLLEKVATIHSTVAASSFEEAYYGVLTANILMWETQEMLYTRDMESVPAEELRDYIRFFSQANMLRNAYIAQSETLYWQFQS